MTSWSAARVARSLVAVIAFAALLSTACRASTTVTEVAFEPTTVDEQASDTPDTADPVELVENGGPVVAEGELSSADVYLAVSDSIVFIETSDFSTGSGIVIEGGWILTNAHVVDRLPSARIGRSDGIDLGEYPVHAIDWVFDLALIGPIDDDQLVAMARVPSSDLAIGDRVLLLGFPDESSVDPTPTLTEGIVNRRRRPVLGDFPWLQVDATIAPGQSGGALIDGEGNLVGISGIEFGAGEFALAFEADAMWPRVDAMLERPQAPEVADDPVTGFVDEVGLHRTVGFLADTDSAGHLEVGAESSADLFIELQSLGGLTVTTVADIVDVFEARDEDTYAYVDEFLEGGENLIVDVVPGRYQVIVGSFESGPSQIDVSSPNELRRFPDVEEGATLPVGRVVEGEFDWARDSDRWQLDLSAGDSVTIVTDGLADTILSVRRNGVVVASSDDEGLGLFGTGSRVEFVADADGVYEVEVGTFDTVRWGYLIEVTIT